MNPVALLSVGVLVSALSLILGFRAGRKSGGITQSTWTTFTTIPPVIIDGALFALIAWFIFNQGYFGGDEAAKYIDPKAKFWLSWIIGSVATLAGALKMFRSQAYAASVKEKDDIKLEAKRRGDTQQFDKKDVANL